MITQQEPDDRDIFNDIQVNILETILDLFETRSENDNDNENDNNQDPELDSSSISSNTQEENVSIPITIPSDETEENDETESVNAISGLNRVLHFLRSNGFLQDNVKYILLLTLFFIVHHLTSFLVFIFYSVISRHANSQIKRHIATLNDIDRENRRQPLFTLSASLLGLLFVICYPYLFLPDGIHLRKALLFQNSNSPDGSSNFWSTLWIMFIVSFTSSFIFLCLKIGYLIHVIIFSRFRGSKLKIMIVMNFIENISIAVRSFQRGVLWFFYLSSFQRFLFFPFCYLGFRVIDVFTLLVSNAKIIISKLKNIYPFGNPSTSEEMRNLPSDSCTICFDPFKNPFTLSCKHIFCAECIHEWLLKKTTCPICRATISNHPLTSREDDRETSFSFYL